MHKKMISCSLVVLTALWCAQTALTQSPTWKPQPKNADAVKALVVTGGHDHDADFYTVFADDRIRAMVDPHPAALRGDIRKSAEVLVLYDMLQDWTEAQRQNLRAFVEAGDKGVVVLHHAIGDNHTWPWWYEEVVGGRYLFNTFAGKKSSYSHDEDQLITPVGAHPITRGLKPFRILDETYKDMWLSPKNNVILKSDNPKSDGPVAWISPYAKARVVYIQLGHDRNAHLNPNYQTLVRNAILWAAKRLP